MSKTKAGLHKNVSAIFSGVPLPSAHVTTPPEQPLPTEMEPPKSDDTQNQNIKNSVLPGCLTNGHKNPDSTSKQKIDIPDSTKVKSDSLPDSPGIVKPLSEKIENKKAELPVTAQKPVFSPAKENKLKDVFGKLQKKLLPANSGAIQPRQKVMVLLVPILFIILVVVFAKALGISPRRTIKQAAAATNKNITFDTNINWDAPESYPETLRDPMKFGSTSANTQDIDGLTVKGIVYSSDNASAVIGTKIVREGQQISGATVIKITKDSVEFEKDGKRIIKNVQK